MAITSRNENFWEQRQLGEILSDLYNGQTPSRNVKEYWKGDIPWLTSGELNHGIVKETVEKISESGKRAANLRLVPSGTIVIAITGLEAPGTRGNCAILGTDTTINQSVMALFVKDNIDTQFIFQWYKKIGQEYGIKYTQGTKQQSYNYDIVKILPIGIPTATEEQKKIGKLLNCFSALIALYERKLKLLSQAKKYFLDNLFAEKEYPNLRFKEFTDAWEQRKLGKVATFINGRAYKQNELLDSGKYKVLRVGNFYTNDSWYYSNLELADKYYIDKGDLVYTWSATFGPHIWNGEKVIYHYHIWKIELSKFLDRYFTLQILEADKAKLLANTNGSTMIHVTKKGMESKVISLPTIEEQKQIGLYLTEFDTLIALYENKKQNLIEIKKSLLNTMFI